jgi:hypothetical protein
MGKTHLGAGESKLRYMDRDDGLLMGYRGNRLIV